jgi:hypothetical protein
VSLRDEPLLTHEMPREEFFPARGGTYLHGPGVEDRSIPAEEWRERCRSEGVTFVSIIEHGADGISIYDDIRFPDVINLRNLSALRRLLIDLSKPLYLDLTGLTHQTWAPLVRAAVYSMVPLVGVYVEPREYTRSSTPTPGMIFDLSERTEGISPLPGFASLRRSSRDESACFIPLLGFEGARFGHVMEQVQPPQHRTIPVVGVPGFRPEFPFYAYSGNRTQLEGDHLAVSVRLAKANCPFDLFHALRRIASDYPNDFLRIAPIGTKPHGLGAILFALSLQDRVEIIYDHPVRKVRRTTGEARVCTYDIDSFVQSDLFRAAGEYAA